VLHPTSISLIEYGGRTGPPGYIGWQNRFLGIDSWDPERFKNTGSVVVLFVFSML
jgi:hypothetical protein